MINIKITLFILTLCVSTFSFSQINESVNFINNANIHVRYIQKEINIDFQLTQNEIAKKDGKNYSIIDNFRIDISSENYYNKLEPSKYSCFANELQSKLDLLYAKNKELLMKQKIF